MTQQEALKSITDGLAALQAATPRAAVAKSGGADDPGTTLLKFAIVVAERANAELAKLPEGAQPALGDGTFFAMFMQILQLLLPLFKTFFPIPG